MFKPLLIAMLVPSVFSLEIYPPPRVITDKASTWPITAETRIVVGSVVSSQDSFTAILLQQDLKQFSGITVPIIRESEASVAGHRIIIGQPGKDTLLARVCAANGVTLSDSIMKADTVGHKRMEGYELECGEDVIIAAPSSDGVFYGVRTLFQIMDEDTSDGRGNGPAFINKARITDWPRAALRMLMYDPGRQPFKINQVKRLIRLNTRFKLNTLHIHFYDDQLMGIRFQNLPLGSENPAAWTLDSIRHLVEYANLYHMEIIPEMEIPGHNTSLLYWYPELNHYGTTPMDWRDERCQWLYEQMLDEIAPVFPSGFVHIGADEAGFVMPAGKDLISIVWPIVDRINRKHGRDYKIIHYLGWNGGTGAYDGTNCPDSLSDYVIDMWWNGSAPNANLDAIYANSKRKMLYQPWGPSNLWCTRYKAYENFIGLDIARWETNHVEPGGELVAGNYMWNPDADIATCTVVPVDQMKRMPETQGWPSSGHYPAYTDPFSMPEEDQWPDFPGFFTPTYSRAFAWDTMSMFCINPPEDTVPVAGTKILAADTVLEQFFTTQLLVETAYQGGAKDTTSDHCTYISLDRRIATVSSTGLVTTLLPGAARILVLRRTTSYPLVPTELTDTLNLTVSGTTSAVDSVLLNLSKADIGLYDTLELHLTGYFHNGSTVFPVNLDSAATWVSGNPAVVSVDKGVAIGLAQAGPVLVTAGWNGHSDTCVVSVPWNTLASMPNSQGGRDRFAASAEGRFVRMVGKQRGTGYGYSIFEFEVWSGGVNVALNRPVTVTSVDAGLLGSYAVDGSGSTRWSSVPADPQTLMVDLGEVVHIDSVVIVWEAAYGKIYVIQAAADTASGGSMGEVKPVVSEGCNLSATPNPFNPSVRITLSGREKPDQLLIYDVRGGVIANLLQDFRNQGVIWNAKAPAGMYIIKAEVNGRRLVKRILLVK